ncbi:hypothetical protein D623_10019210 [Myotis brandtii]|uniref:Uncharacterized protein n=1 Tax=Myotis brandtii TaxID=109478 RepID=S7N777_MYOBR|nr:hypothetical protein D623_10019210 [Myotis brandtii]
MVAAGAELQAERGLRAAVGGARQGHRGCAETRPCAHCSLVAHSSFQVAEPYRTCFTAGGSKTSPLEQQPELQQPQDTVSLPLPPLPHATPDPFTLYNMVSGVGFRSTYSNPITHVIRSGCHGNRQCSSSIQVFTSQKLQAPSSLMERSTVQQVTKVVHSNCRLVCHPCTAVSSSTATTEKCVTYQAGGHLFLPQDLHWKSTGLGVFAVQSIYELTRRHNASPFYSGPP